MNAHQASYAERLSETTTVFEMVDLLDRYTTTHVGTAPAAIKRLTIRRLESRYQAKDEELWKLTLALAHSGHPTAEEVAAMLLSKLYAQHAETVAEELKRLAESANWEVREWAASALGEVTLHYYNQIHPRLQEWIHDPSENARRAVVLGAMYASHTKDSGMAHSLLDLLTPLLWDTTPYVRNNLGPFALGDGFSRRWPDLLLRRLTEWSREPDEPVRWNLAMVFSAQAGASLAPRVPEVLRILSGDTRQVVQKAWKKASQRIQKENPGWTWPEVSSSFGLIAQVIAGPTR